MTTRKPVGKKTPSTTESPPASTPSAEPSTYAEKLTMVAKRAKVKASAKLSAQPPAKPKARGLSLGPPPDVSDETRDGIMARAAADGVVGNARSLIAFSHGTFGELSLIECMKVMTGTAKGLNDGDLSAAVRMLSSQAVALNAMFGELARRSALNMGEYIDASETYMKLALRAQGQCRATLETLAAIKNPPVVFARQANIVNGPQQVNNSGTPPGNAPAQAANSGSAPSKLLEKHDGQWLDTGAASAASRADSNMATVGAIHRPEDR